MPDRSSRTAGTLESGLDVLERLAMAPRGLALTELAQLIEIDKGNLHRLLKVLIARGFVEQVSDSRRYRATAELIHLAGHLLRGLDLRAAGEDVCDRLLEQVGEAVHLGQRSRDGIVYVLQRRPVARVSVDTELGGRPPMHCTATGKVSLAFASPEDRERWMPEELAEFTYRTHTTFEALEADLKRTRERGYALDDEEHHAGARCVAAPVFDVEGEFIGCVGVSTPAQRVALDDLGDLAVHVTRAASEITHRLGGPAPAPSDPGSTP